MPTPSEEVRDLSKVMKEIGDKMRDYALANKWDVVALQAPLLATLIGVLLDRANTVPQTSPEFPAICRVVNNTIAHLNKNALRMESHLQSVLLPIQNRTLH